MALNLNYAENSKPIEKVSLDIKRESFDFFYKELKKFNISIVGLRQVGKTTIAKQLIKALVKESKWKWEDVVYINLKAYENVSKESVLLDLFEHNYKAIIIDEIQVISDWSSMTQILVDQNKECKFIFISSSASSLKNESGLGRMKTFFMNPLSWNEFLQFYPNESFNKFLRYGSFPNINPLLSLEEHYMAIGYGVVVDKVLSDDVAETINKIKFHNFFSSLKNYIGHEIKTTKVISENSLKWITGKKYFDILINSSLISLVPKYEDKNKKSFYKLYYKDKSIIYRFNDNKELNNNDIGVLIENTIFNHLESKFESTRDFSKIFYWRTKTNQEIDFVIPHKKILIESKYANLVKSEWINLLRKINKSLDNKFLDYKKIIITKNDSFKYEGWFGIPVEKFLKNIKDYLI